MGDLFMNHSQNFTHNRKIHLESRSGLRMDFNADGSVHRMMHGDVMINLFPGNGVEAGPIGIFLRCYHVGGEVTYIPLFGPGSPSSYGGDEHGFMARGEWNGLAYTVRLVLAEEAPVWFWYVELQNRSADFVSGDLIYTQDVALASEGAVRLNEFFVSQYVDHTPLEHFECGYVVASRQNQSVGGRTPWLLLGSLTHGVGFATDALQFYGLSARTQEVPRGLAEGLSQKRLQREHSMVAIQDSPFALASGIGISCGFYGLFVPDHPKASSDEDVRRVDEVIALSEVQEVVSDTPELQSGVPSLFTSAPVLNSFALDEETIAHYYGRELRQAEFVEGNLVSFFTPEGDHVVLKEKEMLVLRPHGYLLRSGDALIPDEAALTSTAWMDGVFHSMVTQGHVSINRFLTTCHGFLGFFRSYGMRIFIEVDGHWELLGIPSAFSMAFRSCRWIYRHEGGVLEVKSFAEKDEHLLRVAVRVLEGKPMRLFVSCSLAVNGEDSSLSPPKIETSPEGIRVYASAETDVGRRFPEGFFQVAAESGTVFEAVGRDELLFADGLSRGKHFLCLITESAKEAQFSLEGHLVEVSEAFLNSAVKFSPAELSLSSTESEAPERVGEIFPWFVQNALVHYLSPRGLEQFSGGGWGTRDVCQGPVELLLALGTHEPIRDILLRVFRQQNPDGDWPQWFMFFERERNIRPDDSHGDIVYWPVLALAQYLLTTGDASLLTEKVHFFHTGGPDAGENATIAAHVERAIALMQRRVIKGTHLAAYGHGDWNDSLQPVMPEMRDGLCSPWTVTLAYQTFSTFARAIRFVGQPMRAEELEKTAGKILEEFQRLLIGDGVVAGLADFRRGKRPLLLLHPHDKKTGLHYSLLPMIHAIINEMFSPSQAAHHLNLIREHLHGPDGAHLFDWPMKYHGGPMTLFQRAESASYFGREIGLMYTHAHLRYVEALARYGQADDFFTELCRVNPIGMADFVPSAAIRQSNCYYSSSDAAFYDRYAASDFYEEALRGEIAFEGGWRVYSSGAGISARLIMQCFLGVQLLRNVLILDPIVSPTLGELKAQMRLWGHPFLVRYNSKIAGYSPQSIRLNGHPMSFDREPNRYREGGAIIDMSKIQAALLDEANTLEIDLK